MAYTKAMVDRSNVALPRQHYHQAPYSPHGPPNPSWSQTPATPPRVLGSNSSNGRAYSPSATRTPQMIKCSTCACLVPLLELSDHICKPGQPEASAVAAPLSQRRPMQTRQYSADAHHSGSNHSPYSSNASQPRLAPYPLRLEVSHASSSLPAGPASASSTYIPPPRTPASLSPSPVHTPSNLSPQYGYTRSASASGSDNEDSHSHLSRSPKSPNSFDASASNNAGVGAGGGAGHMPFFEKYQKVYGPTHSNHSGSSAGGSMSSFSSEGRPKMTRAGTSPVLAKSPISHGWPAQASTGHMQRRPSASDGQQLRRQQPDPSRHDPKVLHHKRDQSDSAESQQSSAHSSSRDSNHLLNYLDESPDTSPDMPTTPVFRNLTDELSPGPKGNNNNRKSETGSHQAEDDIIDSYPTPQAGFSERFGSLHVDDQQNSSTQIELEIPELGPMEVSSPLLRSFSGIKETQGVRSFSKGLPMSQSTPDSLARLAGSSDADAQASSRHRQASGDGRPAGISASRSLNQRRRSKTSALSPAMGHVRALATPRLGAGQSEVKSAQIGGEVASAGLGLDARLDDLLKDMNRESLMGSSTPQPVQASTSAISVKRNAPSAPPRHCDSCVNVIPASRKAIKKDGQTFCKECYAELYLPKCQKCTLTIESRAIGSGDGKIKGKYHAACFSCWECSSIFPTGDFYVFEQRPYCGPHYHELNGTMCSNPVCQEGGIEGPCVSLPGEEGESGSRYHPSCFICSHPACTILLDEYHYILAGLPYCERHARELEEDLGPSSGNVSPASDGPREYAGHPAFSSASKIGQDRRRSRSLDVPATSITELRKKAGSPSYFNRNGRMGNRGGPPPSAGNRRAEKRRTVIQDVSRR